MRFQAKQDLLNFGNMLIILKNVDQVQICALGPELNLSQLQFQVRPYVLNCPTCFFMFKTR